METLATDSTDHETSAQQSGWDETSEHPGDANSDSGESLFITQAPVPEAVRSERRRRCTLTSTQTDDDTSDSSSDENSKTDKKRIRKKVPMFSFPFLAERANEQSITELPRRQNNRLHKSLMRGYFECVRTMWNGYERGDLLTSLPTVDMNEVHIPPISEVEEEEPEDEEFKVVEKKRFVVTLKVYGAFCHIQDGGLVDVSLQRTNSLNAASSKGQVQTMDYSGDLVKVTSSNGSQWTAQKVLVTVPLTLLQRGLLHFHPSLPERKLKAIHSLGAGIIEKIALQFPTRFWDSKIQGADYFGHIPPAPEKLGLFSVFYDLDPQGKQAVLMSVISGDAVPAVCELEDQEVVGECLKVLRELFPEQDVPDPVNYFVTHWSKDRWSQMSYSFVKTGGSGEAYDVLAEDVQGKLFFAGEATNRHFPQTVTGAYLSGVREASKMAAV
ncbi:lysine-specific histone demethylase 2-like isoform 5-T9 [Menidia menidia]